MNKRMTLGAALLAASLGLNAQKPMSAPSGGKAISDELIGIFFEDISSAADGGFFDFDQHVVDAVLRDGDVHQFQADSAFAFADRFHSCFRCSFGCGFAKMNFGSIYYTRSGKSRPGRKICRNKKALRRGGD